MKIHFRIPASLRYEVLREFQLAKAEEIKDAFLKAWCHLERAHILGQAGPVEHSITR